MRVVIARSLLDNFEMEECQKGVEEKDKKYFLLRRIEGIEKEIEDLHE